MRSWNNPKAPETGKLGRLLREQAPVVIMVGIPAAIGILSLITSL